MRNIIISLLPIMIISIYFFGYRGLLVLLSVNIAGFLTEYLFCKYYFKTPVSSAVFVTNILFALSLPPTLPIWMAIIGIVFGITFGKMVFGGFGRNIFNPALVGRAFIYVSFAVKMNGIWNRPLFGIPGGFGNYISEAITTATPIRIMASGGTVALKNLFLGSTAGCLGETSAIFSRKWRCWR